MRTSKLRPLIFLVPLALSLLALGHKSELQAWAAGARPGLTAHAERTPAPPFPTDTHTLDGAPISLDALRGRVVLLHFWTFGCSNCKHMLPRYADWRERLSGRGLSVVGVHTPEMDWEADKAALARFVTEQHIRWPVIVDADQAIWNRYQVMAGPTVVLIDRRGDVRATFVGDDRAPAIEAALQQLLGEAPQTR
jgi:thiol-disulfide isomerase/thioredoxin